MPFPWATLSLTQRSVDQGQKRTCCGFLWESRQPHEGVFYPWNPVDSDEKGPQLRSYRSFWPFDVDLPATLMRGIRGRFIEQCTIDAEAKPPPYLVAAMFWNPDNNGQ